MWKLYVGHIESNGLTYSAEIVKTFETELDALKYEDTLIREYLENGSVLVNKTMKKIKDLARPLIIDGVFKIGPRRDRNTILASLVRNKRRAVKLTQSELADKAGVGLRFMRELENGKPTLRLDKINQVLHLFGHELSPMPKTR
jgi:y4mF family transcriptional regulator